MKNLSIILSIIAIVISIYVLTLKAKINTPILKGALEGSASNSVVRVQNQSGSADIIKSRGGVLSAINITGSAAGVMNFYDASTTNASLRVPQATSSLRLITTIPASASAFPYPYNVSFTNGLIMEVIGTAPTTTIIYN